VFRATPNPPQELDENEEYVEAEDEFDAAKQCSPLRRGRDSDGEEGGDVDVLTREPLLLFSSDGEDEEGEGGEAPLLHLPAVSSWLHWLEAGALGQAGWLS
jgi:hypothetical protein